MSHITTFVEAEGFSNAPCFEAPQPKRRRLPVFVRGGVAGQAPCAYGVHSGSVLVVGAPEENSECPTTQPPRPLDYPVPR